MMRVSAVQKAYAALVELDQVVVDLDVATDAELTDAELLMMAREEALDALASGELVGPKLNEFAYARALLAATGRADHLDGAVVPAIADTLDGAA